MIMALLTLMAAAATLAYASDDRSYQGETCDTTHTTTQGMAFLMTQKHLSKTKLVALKKSSCSHLPLRRFSFVKSPAKPVTEAERGGAACSFKGANCNTETPEHELVQRHMPVDAAVLEFGARFGTTSCQIAAGQRNSGKVVSVEPDTSVWNDFASNMRSHSCRVSLLKGVIGSKSREVATASYGTRAIKAAAPGSGAPAINFEDVETCMGFTFDTLLIDCEGCITFLLDESPRLFTKIKWIFMEADMGVYNGSRAPDCGSNCVSYDDVIPRLQTQYGFEVVETFKEQQPGRESKRDCCPWIHHFALRRQL